MRVVVAIIVNEQKEVLITQRPAHKPLPGLWEFPGGKVEAQESLAAALIREIKEEVGLDIINYCFKKDVNTNFGSNEVVLSLFTVHKTTGTPQALEQQPGLKWVKHTDLNKYEFPEGNYQFMSLLKDWI